MNAPTRSVATILFADIRGFTHLSQTRDPDVVFRLFGEYCQAMTAALVQEGGRVHRMIGDGMLAVFGLGENDNEHAGKAIRGALALLAEAERLSAWWERQAGSPLRIVVALHTGEVLVGPLVGDGMSELALFGDAVNVAARLEAVAKELQVPIILTGETARLIAGTYPFRALGRKQLRGRAGQLDLFALGTTRPIDTGDNPFRTREMFGGV